MPNRTVLLGILWTSAAILAVIGLWSLQPAQMAKGLPSAAMLVSAAVLALVAWAVRSHLDSSESKVRKSERRAEMFEREIRRQKEVVDALADGLEVAIFLCDQKAIVDYANRKAIELFEFQEPKGRNILDVTLSDDLRALVQQAHERGVPQNGEITFRYPVERTGLCKSWIDPTHSERVFVTIYEITNLRRLERARRDFVANVSHELRTPMTTIRAMSETLLDGDQEDYQLLGKKYLERIIREVDRLTLISDDLLTLSAAESKQVDKSLTNLSDVVHVAVTNLQEKAHEKGLEIVLSAPPRLEALANSHQMAQVIFNLVDNAINYTNEGSIRVELKQQGEDAVFTVEDTGIGIAPEEQTRIFERFYRVDKGRSRASGSTGLGLSIVKHIVEAHGGKVTVASEFGQGTTFTVILPCGLAEPAA